MGADFPASSRVEKADLSPESSVCAFVGNQLTVYFWTLDSVPLLRALSLCRASLDGCGLAVHFQTYFVLLRDCLSSPRPLLSMQWVWVSASAAAASSCQCQNLPERLAGPHLSPHQGLGVQGCDAQGVGPVVRKGLLHVSRPGSGCVLGARSQRLMSPGEGTQGAELPESWATQVTGQGVRLGCLMEGLGRTGRLEFSL